MTQSTTTSMIDLARIQPNPYQPRESEDPAHVARVAESILAEGLLQAPVGRLMKDHLVQLAFGHTRWAAYRLLDQLAQDGESSGQDLRETPGLAKLLAQRVAGELPQSARYEWNYLPVVIRELKDEDMFRLAISENVARRDLTPIEEARAMNRYRTEFGKTSTAIGALFGLSDSAVRNKMRLLDLPESIQNQVRSGQISEGSARMLLGVQRAAPQAMAVAAERMASQKLDNPKSVSEAIRDELRKTAFEMCGPWREKTIAGNGLWAFGWTPDPECLPAMSREKVNKTLGELQLEPFSETLQLQMAWESAVSGDLRELNGRLGLRPDEQKLRTTEALMVLARPPACSTCPFYARIDGYHYCGIKACWERKRYAWMKQEAERLSEELKIPIYDRERDGSPYQELQGWDADARKFWQEKADHLRLTPRYSEYNKHAFSDNACVMVVSVRKKFQEEAVAEKAAEKVAAAAQKDAAQRRAEIQKQINASNEFLAKVAVPVLAHSLAGLSDGAVEILCRVMFDWTFTFEQVKRRSGGDLRKVIWMRGMLKEGDLSLVPENARKAGPVACAEHLQGMATAWGGGMQLPADWLEQAKQFQAVEVLNDGDPN